MKYSERLHSEFQRLSDEYGYPVIKELAYLLASGGNVHQLSRQYSISKYSLVFLGRFSAEFLVFSHQREKPVRLVYSNVA